MSFLTPRSMFQLILSILPLLPSITAIPTQKTSPSSPLTKRGPVLECSGEIDAAGLPAGFTPATFGNSMTIFCGPGFVGCICDENGHLDCIGDDDDDRMNVNPALSISDAALDCYDRCTCPDIAPDTPTNPPRRPALIDDSDSESEDIEDLGEGLADLDIDETPSTDADFDVAQPPPQHTRPHPSAVAATGHHCFSSTCSSFSGCGRGVSGGCRCIVAPASAGIFFFKGICAGSPSKRDVGAVPDACPCNGTYVSEACCGAPDGVVYEGPEKKLGELVPGWH
ncbi:MAG: hypothetical protein M1817_005395 [Caeruleum heppii]|nr:MAG: hypothetical protein M1817_005395 [Caeruleum heppii]